MKPINERILEISDEMYIKNIQPTSIVLNEVDYVDLKSEVIPKLRSEANRHHSTKLFKFDSFIGIKIEVKEGDSIESYVTGWGSGEKCEIRGYQQIKIANDN